MDPPPEPLRCLLPSLPLLLPLALVFTHRSCALLTLLALWWLLSYVYINGLPYQAFKKESGSFDSSNPSCRSRFRHTPGHYDTKSVLFYSKFKNTITNWEPRRKLLFAFSTFQFPEGVPHSLELHLGEQSRLVSFFKKFQS